MTKFLLFNVRLVFVGGGRAGARLLDTNAIGGLIKRNLSRE